MALHANDSDDYMPDSESSDYNEEDDERPNRWAGPPSTWQQLNSAEIDTLTALHEIRNQDLSVHLYNAFALKQRHRRPQDGTQGPVPEQDINKATGLPIAQDAWVPPKSWTAWPMRLNKVPPPEFMKRADGADEQFTFRKAVRDVPSTALEETISAAVLRSAKERFNVRPWVEADGVDSESGGSDDGGSDTETVPASSRARSRSKSKSKSKSIKPESVSESENKNRMDIDESGGEAPHVYAPPKKRRLKPTVATDDDLSYALLRPSVRHIMSKLDTTLMVLHNAQESALQYQSDSAESDASDTSQRSGQSRDRSRPSGRKRGRPPKSGEPSQMRESAPPPEPEPSADGAKKKKRQGRPKKYYPKLEGETDREYTIRVARLRKEPVPFFADTEPQAGAESSPAPVSAPDSGVEPGREDSPGEDSASAPKPQKTRRNAKKVQSVEDPDREEAAPANPNPVKPRLGLRDWTDVLGAAALAGFSPGALDRAARRCADIFQQIMVLQTLVEEAPPPSHHSQNHHHAPQAQRITRYEPGMASVPLLGREDEDDEEEEEVRYARNALRRSQSRSRALSAEPPKSEDESRGRGRSVSGSSRSRSASITNTSYFCAFRDCPRAVDAFARKTNLVRHMKLVHGYEEGTSIQGDMGDMGMMGMMGMGLDEVDSEDEMYGAVHVDGFLRPIRVRQGWRAGDVAEEPRSRRRRAGRGRVRRGSGSSDLDTGREGSGFK
ncbi:Uu.00g027270.m01.CDS01 [Anthostomella pinea]|uniref:Uu.00g027270.m01.CDS01 n=1 Tax=Anthostomella pinea TaxID=933095 RepID=A0AAI8YA98_9PEZI|nr:Uu.00g027270.m01.CDS01 [Anthostomella pinea]